MRLKQWIIPIIFVIFGGIMATSYSYWNLADPQRTCASCHEILPSVHSFATSSHRELSCTECHGTALSNGFHSLMEKGRMVVNHFREEDLENIRMSEVQLIAMMDNCQRCHASEYAKWEAGAHSMNYAEIFLSVEQNTKEQINFDCLRCHGMFFEGYLDEIVTPIDTVGPWEILDTKLAKRPAIPCMACHQIHRPGAIAAQFLQNSEETDAGMEEMLVVSLTFFDKNDQRYIPGFDLPVLRTFIDGKQINVSDDPRTRVCVQCHAPNAFHLSGSADDRTPRGVHQGLSCMSCHQPHSNNARNSCVSCHPAISNCGLDVTQMNTTFKNPDSPFDIHFVSCDDCH